MDTPDRRDLLVISDLHLGEGLGRDAPIDPRLEQELVAFLDHHRGPEREGPTPRRWRLVVNGDAIDLVGMTILPADVACAGELHPDDQKYGLGGRSHAASVKVARVVEHHGDVIRALARFVGEGHDLALVVGNHDAELHWPGVQDTLRDGIAAAWDREPASRLPGARTADEVRAAVRFHEWFFLEDGVAWIEHGHQYDPYCSFEDALAPATDGQEIDPNVGGMLLRYVTHQFGHDVHDAWGFSFFGYLRMWWRQGLARGVGIGRGYRDMCMRLVAHWRQRLPERLAERRLRARERLVTMAANVRLSEERLLELAALWRPPHAADLGRLVRALMLDRLSLVLLGPLLACVPLLVLPHGWQLAGAGVLAFPLGAWFGTAITARESSDARSALRSTAGLIRRITGVPIVVMGHTHDPCAESDAGGWYFNTGTWVAHADPRKAFTHVRIEHTDAGVTALLCQWRGGASVAYDPPPELSAA
jgi:UDP-2,3-diacylglucosamine pyrophosphatase LpxH